MEGEAQRLQALQDVALAVNSTLDPGDVLNLILERACDLLGARQGSLMLVDQGDQQLHIAVAYGLSPAVVQTARVPLGEGVAGGVAASGEPRRLAAGIREREGRTVQVPAAVCVPLKVGDQVLGVLNLSDRVDGGEFGDDDTALASLFAAQSAVAIRNAEAFREQTRQAAQLRALHDVTLAINQTLDVNDTLQQVLDEAIELLEARQGSVMLLDRAGSELTIAVAHGLTDEVVSSTRVPLGQGVAGEVAETGQPRNLPAGVKAAGSLMSETRERQAALCAPLQVAGHVIGVLNVSGRQDGGDFRDEDLGILLTLAMQAAIAINNAQLYEASHHQVEALGALNDIGRALTGTLHRDEVLDRVLESSLRLLRCRKGSLMLIQTNEVQSEEYDPALPDLDRRDEPERHLEIVIARGLPEEVVHTVRIRVGEGIAGRVAETGEAAVMQQGEVDARSASQERSASVCLPLKVKDHVIGVLNLSEHDSGDFDEDDLQLGTTLAAQAAAAIENAQLYDDLQDQFVHSIRVIANAIDARDPYTRGHSERVALYAKMIAAELGLPPEEVDNIYYAGLLHDVGKIGIRDAILLKEGKLTDDEFHVMQQHPVKSAEIIYPVKQLRHLLPGLRHHHERFSAKGYPDGLHEEQIPLMARILGVADTYDAMTSDRPYREALPRRVALEELAKNRGLQFDPECVNAFMTLAERGELEPVDGQGATGAEDVRAAMAAAEGALQDREG